jgi:DNA ligase-1
MPKIKAPMLATNFSDAKIQYPLAATPKLDGIRCLKVDGEFVSRSFKPIRNLHIKKVLASLELPDGVDGELVSGSNFNSTTSGVMSITGTPDFKYYIFDYVDPDKELPYLERLDTLCMKISKVLATSEIIEILLPEILYNPEDLNSYLENLDIRYEGVMLREPNSAYEFKRSKKLIKVKSFEDSEAEVVGFNEKMTNTNPQQTDNFGHSTRSSSKAGLVGANTLGSVRVRDLEGNEFNVGSGFDDSTREFIWNNREKFLGQLLKYKHMPHGQKSLPRHPVFLGFRHKDDL